MDIIFYVTRPEGHYGTGRNSDKLKDSAPRYPTTKPDATKLLRCAEDALTGILYEDDAQIVNQNIRKRYGRPGAKIEVAPYSEDDELI